MHQKVVFILSLLVVFSVVAAGMALGADENLDKNFETESTSDPTVCDYDSIVDSVGGYTTGHAGLSLCGKASQTNPPWLYNIHAYANGYGTCYIVYVSQVPSEAYYHVGADAYTGCGDLHAEINWMAAR